MSARKFPKTLKRRIAPALVGAVCLTAAKSATAQTTVAVPLLLSGWNNNVFFGTADNNDVVFSGTGAEGGNSALPNRTMDNASNSPFIYGPCCVTSVPNADGFFPGAYYKSAATSLVAGDTSAVFAFNGYTSFIPSGLSTNADYDNSIIAAGSFNASFNSSIVNESSMLYSSTTSLETNTLTMENPSRVKNIYLYMNAGNGPGTVTITFSYANSHSFTYTETVADWYYTNGNTSINALPNPFDLVSVSTSTGALYESSSYNRQIYQFDISAPDTSDALDSITFKTNTSSNNASVTQINIMAVSATSPAPAPPSGLPFLIGSGLGCLKLLRRRRRSKTA